MRVRFEMFKNGRPVGVTAECDLTPKKARILFNDLKNNLKCGWAELVAEDEDEGGYMEVMDSFDNVKRANMITSMF